MSSDQTSIHAGYLPDGEHFDRVRFDFDLSRRHFMQILGAGLLIAVCDTPVWAQDRRGGQGGSGSDGQMTVAARLHIGQDGRITLLTGKVEGGQGARTELTQAAAEELRVAPEQVTAIMADTSIVPNDGITAGSRSTPNTVPAVRQAAATARNLLIDSACRQWQVEPAEVQVKDGSVLHASSGRSLSYADLASSPAAIEAFKQAIPEQVQITAVEEWKVMGLPLPRPNGRDIVTGAHRFPSDITRPGMVYGKVLRPPAFGAKLVQIDVEAAKAIKDVSVVQDGSFVGVAAPNSWLAEQALDALAATARWDTTPQISNSELYEHLRQTAREGVPPNPFEAELTDPAKAFRQTYTTAYVQHAPMEPRAAVAEWNQDNTLTVWTASQNPFGVRGELARAMDMPEDRVSVIVPDFGGGFGGKHSAECAVEAARISRSAARPVSLRWTRQEEFTWAYFRPAAVMDVQAGLDADGRIGSWHMVNINSGRAALETPYQIARTNHQYVESQAPLRHGSYRALAATANAFARECAMDELAMIAQQDPLAFRLRHIENARLRDVLVAAAEKSGWSDRETGREPNAGMGLACATEKGSYVGTCAQAAVDPRTGKITVRRIVLAFECGAIINPDNLLSQVQGCIVMALGPALREEIQFSDGSIQNASFAQYAVPRFADVPKLDIHLLDRRDLPSVGAGETPLIAVAPAIANAIFAACGQRVRALPMRLATGAAPTR